MKRHESGQAIILILLSLSVVLTIVLFLLSRSTIDITSSSRHADAVRAFSAAEAGIERSLIVGTGFGATGIGEGASYTTTVSDFALGGTSVPFPYPIYYGDVVTVWFVSHAANGDQICDVTNPCFFSDSPSLTVCWGNPGAEANTNSDTTPAIELSIYYRSDPALPDTVKVWRVPVDPNTVRRSGNYFSAPMAGTCSIGGQTYAFQRSIRIPDTNIPLSSYSKAGGLRLAQIRMLYNDVPHVVGVAVDGATLPSQGKEINSIGTAGDANRRILVYQSWPEFPFGSNALMSPLGIVKN